jgi:hypothetical protein
MLRDSSSLKLRIFLKKYRLPIAHHSFKDAPAVCPTDIWIMKRTCQDRSCIHESFMVLKYLIKTLYSKNVKYQTIMKNLSNIMLDMGFDFSNSTSICLYLMLWESPTYIL